MGTTTTHTRKILRVGGSFLVSIPQEFVRKNGLKAGDTIGIISNDIFILGVPREPVKSKDDIRSI